MEWSNLGSLGSGWLAFALIAAAGALPIGYRMRNGRRATPTSTLTQVHVAAGIGVVLVAFLHALLGLLALGSSRAIGASDLAIWAGSAALLVLMAHVGIGLQLRNPKLRRRLELRSKHVVTAATIALCAVVHVALLVGGE